MARPRKFGLDYFSVETSDFHSTETGALLRRHKSDGYAVVMYLKSAIFEKGYYLTFDEIEREAFYDRFSWIMKEQLEAILDDCFRLRIFDEELYRAEGVLSGVEIQKFYFFASEWRIRDDIDFEYLLIKVPNNDAKAHKKRSNSKKTSENSVCNKNNVNESELAENSEVAKTLGVCQSQKKEKEKKGKESKLKQENTDVFFLKKNDSAGKPALTEKTTGGAEGLGIASGKAENAGKAESAGKAAQAPAVTIKDSNPVPPQKARSGGNERYMPVGDDSTVLFVNDQGQNCYALDDLIKRRLNAPLWVEQTCITYGIRPDEMPRYMQLFKNHYLARMNPEATSDKRFANYFINWLALRVRDKRRDDSYQQLMNDREAKFDARMAQRDAKHDARMERREAQMESAGELRRLREDPCRLERDKTTVIGDFQPVKLMKYELAEGDIF
jgi:hypothetical protein